MRIVHVFRTPVGGLFRHVMDLAREQADRNHDVGLICDSSTGGERADAALQRLAPTLSLGAHRLPMARLPGLGDLRALLAVRETLARLKPDVAHGHGAKGGLYARSAWGLGPQTVRAYTPHGGSFHYEPDRLSHRLYLAVERRLAPRTDVFLLESAYIGRRVDRIVGSHAALHRVIVNGLTDAEFIPVVHDPDAADLLFVGELRLLKGIDTLFAALGLLREKGRIPSLLVVGGGPDEALLKMQVEERGLGGQVRFHGPAPIASVMSKGRIMVVPSRSDSLPYVVLEAAAAAQPLVATDVGGIPEIFGPQAGRLISRDDPERLAATLADMLDRPPEDIAAESAALRDDVRERFTMAKMAEGVLSGYEAALARRRGGKSGSDSSH